MPTIAGRKRETWRIREFLDRKGLNMSSYARQIGISKNQVWKTLRGDDDSERVLSGLVEMGCPVGILSLPEKMKTKRSKK